MKKARLLILGSLLSGTANLGAAELILDLEKVAVSGLSSGGYMANQFHVAHSKWVDKVGIIAAGPYYCANNSIKEALEKCVTKRANDINKELTIQAELYSKNAEIDPLEELSNSKVWILRGNKDKTIALGVTEALFTQYQNWLGQEQLRYINDRPFGHNFPTLKNGKECEESTSPFIGNCNYDAAGEMLNFLYGALMPRTAEATGELISFDQQELGGDAAKSLATKGYVYIPKTCQQGEICQVHINFHGCQQNHETIGLEYMNENGINNWADTNHLVIVYPQTKNSMFMPLNPKGCWDWWGYTGSAYATKAGSQIMAVKNIVSSLSKHIKMENNDEQ